MPKIVEEVFFDGAAEKIERLGMDSLMKEIRHIVTNFHLHILEEKDANSSGILRKMIDRSFIAAGGWKKTVSGGIDWLKCKEVNGSKICVGVEVQVSSRSDLIFRDVIHFRNQMIAGAIDLCVLILPSDRLQRFLPDRTPSMADGKRIVGDEMKAHDLPIVLLSIEHDARSDSALTKFVTNLGTGKKGPPTR